MPPPEGKEDQYNAEEMMHLITDLVTEINHKCHYYYRLVKDCLKGGFQEEVKTGNLGKEMHESFDHVRTVWNNAYGVIFDSYINQMTKKESSSVNYANLV